MIRKFLGPRNRPSKHFSVGGWGCHMSWIKGTFHVISVGYWLANRAGPGRVASSGLGGGGPGCLVWVSLCLSLCPFNMTTYSMLRAFTHFCLIISQCRVLHAPSPALLWAQGVDTHNGMLLKAPLIIATSRPASEELATYFEIRQLRTRGCNHTYSKCSQNLNPGLSDSS